MFLCYNWIQMQMTSGQAKGNTQSMLVSLETHRNPRKGQISSKESNWSADKQKRNIYGGTANTGGGKQTKAGSKPFETQREGNCQSKTGNETRRHPEKLKDVKNRQQVKKSVKKAEFLAAGRSSRLRLSMPGCYSRAHVHPRACPTDAVQHPLTHTPRRQHGTPCVRRVRRWSDGLVLSRYTHLPRAPSGPPHTIMVAMPTLNAACLCLFQPLLRTACLAGTPADSQTWI